MTLVLKTARAEVWHDLRADEFYVYANDPASCRCSPASAASTLGLERTGGFETVAFCEIDPFCRRVLAKHWPEVPCYHDVRELTAERLAADGIAVDVICGGFPCQDISEAGKRVGIDGERSGLWSEYRSPHWRASTALRARGKRRSARSPRTRSSARCDLAALGYDAEWDCVGS
jgi:DNA (cytosine-5)-methyltransferase 1